MGTDSTLLSYMNVFSIIVFWLSVWLSIDFFVSAYNCLKHYGDIVHVGDKTYEVTFWTCCPWVIVFIDILLNIYIAMPLVLYKSFCLSCDSITPSDFLKSVRKIYQCDCLFPCVTGYIWLMYRANSSDYYTGNDEYINHVFSWLFWICPVTILLNCMMVTRMRNAILRDTSDYQTL